MVGPQHFGVTQVRPAENIFRGHAYFELWKRFERLYLNTLPTTVDNLVRDYKPASTEEIFNQIKGDLEDAIATLAWDIPNKDYGRITKAVAKHVRAQVAMWEKDYDKAIKECEDGRCFQRGGPA